MMPDDPFSLTPDSPLVTAASASPPAVSPDSYQQRMDALYEKQGGLIDRASQSMDREAQIYEDKSRALAPIRQRMADLAAQPLPQPPQMQQPPAAPHRIDQQESENWVMASGLLGALAGALTRRHQTNALAAFTGAMQGYQEGSREKFDQNMKVWEAENKRVIETNQNALAHYRQILETRNQNMEQMSVALQMAAAQYDDQAMATAAKTKNSLVIAQLYDKQAKTLGDMRESSQKITMGLQQQREAEWKKQADAWINSDKGQATIQAMRSYQIAPPSTNTRTGLEAAINREVWSQLAMTPGGFDQGKFARDQATKKAQALLPIQVERASETSAARTQATREAQLDLILRSAKPSIQKAADASLAVPRTTFTHLNELFQMAESEIGDPALLTFRLANQQVAEQWAKAMNPTGTMAVAYFHVAQDKLSTATSPESYMSALKFLDGWMDQEIAAAKSKAPQTVKWPDNPAHSTTIGQMPGAIQQQEDALRERTGIDPSSPRLFDGGEFQPRTLLPEWMRTPEWLRNKIYTPPSQRAPGGGANMPIPGLSGWHSDVIDPGHQVAGLEDWQIEAIG